MIAKWHPCSIGQWICGVLLLFCMHMTVLFASSVVGLTCNNMEYTVVKEKLCFAISVNRLTR
jgi:hypothetical protein